MARLASRSRTTVLALALVIAYAAGLAAYLLSFLEPVYNAELGTLDWRFLFRGPIGEKPPEIVLVTVDEEADLPYWAPVPREHLAKVITSLSRGGARLIGVDFYLGSSSFDARGDSLLQEAIRQAGNVVLVSFLARDTEGQLQEHLAMPFFQEAALDYGYATFFTGTGAESVRDGKVAAGIQGKHALSLAGCLYARARGLDTGQIRQLDWSKRHPDLPGSQDDYRQIVDYNGPPFQYYRGLDHEMPGGIAAFPSHQVATLPPMLVQRFFQDRIVLLGSGLSDAPDIYRTPFFSQQYNYERTFGVEIHAHFLRTLLSGGALQRSGFFLTALVVLVPAFLAALVAVRLRAYLAFPLTVVDLLLLWALGFFLFGAHQLVVPLIMPTLAGGLACLFGLIYVGSTDGRRKNEARERFGPMVGPEQLEQLLEQPEAWVTDGEERIVSILWACLRAPEGGGNQNSARETVVFFQEYWNRMSALVFKHGGAIFRYEEDSLAAVFGAPLPGREHAQQATMAAIDLAEAWLGLRQDGGHPNWDLRVGADTGRVFLGELGGGERFAFRVLGGPVDRARSLAEIPDGEGDIRISRELLGQVETQVEADPVGSVDGEPIFRVRGRVAAPPIGAAQQPANPFWKYLGLGRDREDPISEELLSQLALFADFNKQDLRHVRPLLYHRAYKGGERIFTQGEVGSGMYVIQRGSVDILQEEEGQPTQLLQRLGEGDFFGELALLSDLPRPASAVAYEPTELLVLFQADLYDLIERAPELGVRLIRTLSRILGERLLQVNEQLVRLEHSNPEKAG